MFFDPLYLIMALPALLLSIYAQFKVKSTYSAYAQQPSMRGVTGAQAASHILNANGLRNVAIEVTQGYLSDHMSGLVTLGLILFSAVVLFQIITLPVEFNASSRALQSLTATGILSQDELYGARKVLSAAALTYVAAAVAAIAQLLYFLIRSGFLGGNSDE